jgi:desulfoferrodoxin (superoxide reductase-like protein)
VRTPLPEYTESYAREWETIAPEHIPQIKFIHRESGEFIQIYVPLKDASASHYIEKIGIADKETKADLDVAVIPRGSKKFQVELPYKYNDNQVKVFVKCNMHDMWTVDDLGRFR